jgi:hypothetical protein
MRNCRTFLLLFMGNGCWWKVQTSFEEEKREEVLKGEAWQATSAYLEAGFGDEQHLHAVEKSQAALPLPPADCVADRESGHVRKRSGQHDRDLLGARERLHCTLQHWNSPSQPCGEHCYAIPQLLCATDERVEWTVHQMESLRNQS